MYNEGTVFMQPGVFPYLLGNGLDGGETIFWNELSSMKQNAWAKWPETAGSGSAELCQSTVTKNIKK